MTEVQKPFTIDTLGDHWDVCRATVFNRIRVYEMETSQIGNRTYIPPSEVARVDRQTLRRPGKLSKSRNRNPKGRPVKDAAA